MSGSQTHQRPSISARTHSQVSMLMLSCLYVVRTEILAPSPRHVRHQQRLGDIYDVVPHRDLSIYGAIHFPTITLIRAPVP